MKLYRYNFSGFSPQMGAMIQGALSAVVYGPPDGEDAAFELAGLIADGWTRKAAGEWMELQGCPVKGFRVRSAGRVQ